MTAESWQQLKPKARRSRLVGRPLPQGEALRKLVHAAMGLFALWLPYLTLMQAIACAVSAFVFNWLVLPALLGHRFKTARDSSGDGGVLAYPLVVLALLIVFRGSEEFAAFGWGTLAFGDALGGFVGQKWGRIPLPWNSRKTWEGFAGFVLGGLVGGSVLALWYKTANHPENHSLATLLADWQFWLVWGFIPIIFGAVLESIPHGLDDNLLPPLMVPALGFLGVTGGGGGELTELWLALGVNTICALVALASKALRPSGIATAWVVGVVTWLGAGWQAFALLLAFLLAGLFATFLGFGRKLRQGIAEGFKGKRGMGEVLAKGGVLLTLALQGLVASGPGAGVVGWAIVATLAAAWADTWASELGKVFGRRAFALPDFREVAPGTVGAISWPGLVGALAGGLLAAGAGVLLGLEPRWPWAVAIGVTALAATVVESVLPALGAASHAGRNLAVTSLPLIVVLALTGTTP